MLECLAERSDEMITKGGLVCVSYKRWRKRMDPVTAS